MAQFRDNYIQDQKQFPLFLQSTKATFHKNFNERVFQECFQIKILMKQFLQPNYHPNKLFDNQKLVEYIKENMPLTRKTLRQFDEQMNKLESYFHDLVHLSLPVDDYLNRFFLVLEKKQKDYFENQVDAVVRREIGFKINQIPPDFQFPSLRIHIRDKLVKMSNKLFDHFGAVNTPPEYDRQVLKRIESILMLYDNLRPDKSWQFLIRRTSLNLGQIFQDVVIKNGKINNLQELVQHLFVVQMKVIKEEISVTNDQQAPFFLLNKDYVLNKFHSILKDRAEANPSDDDILHIIKSVLAKDTRKTFSEFYSQINAELAKINPQIYGFGVEKNDDKINDKKRNLYDSIMKIRKDFDELRSDENYNLIFNGIVTEESIRLTPQESSKQLEDFKELQTFQTKGIFQILINNYFHIFAVSNVQYDAVSLLKNIIDFKQEQQDTIEKELDQSLSQCLNVIR